jgi:hypothetical protein
MACDLALYLLKQGSYSTEGDIVILVGFDIHAVPIIC